MKPYFVKTPYLLKKFYSKRVWDVPSSKKSIYLTFDDGPIPEVTPWVLQQLKAYNAKATFFCIGKNVKKNPELFQQLIEEGHSIGNHTNNHLNGWATRDDKYFRDAEKSQEIIRKHLSYNSAESFRMQKLFRPPYGKMTSKQAKELIKRGYKIIMWDVLSADYDQSISEERCTLNVLNNVTNGSIIIFHDSIKAERNLMKALPKTLEFFHKKGFSFKAL